jgi:PAS domain-containing protein
MIKKILFGLIIMWSCASCNKKNDDVLIKNNSVPNPYLVPEIKVLNYINRLYIDLLGRTPTQVEKDRELLFLREHNLSIPSRIDLIERLQFDSTYVEGDSSYSIAYYNRQYELCKSRLLEGVDDGEMSGQIGILQFGVTVARLEGDSARVYRNLLEISRYQRVLQSRLAYRYGQITIREMYSAMLNNGIYDIINMNSFNFVNASFDDLFDRFPTAQEFENAYAVIDRNEGRFIFGQFVDHKFDYCRALTESVSFAEGLVRWTCFNLMGRQPTPNELYRLTKNFTENHLHTLIQRHYLQSNEYAQF